MPRRGRPAYTAAQIEAWVKAIEAGEYQLKDKDERKRIRAYALALGVKLCDNSILLPHQERRTTYLEKVCRKCHISKPLVDFHVSPDYKDGRQRLCKRCAIEQAHMSSIRKKYGITPEEYRKLLDQQGGVCAICKHPSTARNRRGTIYPLSVDHNHLTGQVRGLLCLTCNQGIGLLQEDVARLQAAIAYLQSESKL